MTNYTQNYNTLGEVTSTAVYFYASGTEIVRAASAQAEAMNAQINTFRQDNGIDGHRPDR